MRRFQPGDPRVAAALLTIVTAAVAFAGCGSLSNAVKADSALPGASQPPASVGVPFGPGPEAVWSGAPREPVETPCPICGSVYELAVSPMAVAAAVPVPAAEKTARKPVKKPVYPVESVKPEDAPEAEAEEALASIEGEEEPAASADDETFLEEEEEDGADMTGIIGGPAAEPEEPQ